MPTKIIPSAKEKSRFFVHLAIFLIASAIMLLTYKGGSDVWTYPWPAWIIAAWGLTVFAHACLVFWSYEDPELDEFNRMSQDMGPN